MKSLFLSVVASSLIAFNGLAQKTLSVNDIWVNYSFIPNLPQALTP